VSAGARPDNGRHSETSRRDAVIAVLVTAVATWVGMLVMNMIDLGNFLVEGTVAVLFGAAVGLLVPWLMVRRRRQNR
jgi:hypothetical protein